MAEGFENGADTGASVKAKSRNTESDSKKTLKAIRRGVEDVSPLLIL